MPNFVTNILTVSGPQELVIAFMESIRGKDDENGSPRFISFDKLVPMPDELRCVFFEGAFLPEDESDRLTAKYGYDNWYYWASNNWGTKEDAYHQWSLEDNRIRFDTSWSTPLQFFERVAKDNPELIFEIEYADEDLGGNCGRYIFADGEFVSDWKPDKAYSAEAKKWAWALGAELESTDENLREAGFDPETMEYLDD